MREGVVNDNRQKERRGEGVKMSSRDKKNKKRGKRKDLKRGREERERCSCRESMRRSLKGWASERAKSD